MQEWTWEKDWGKEKARLETLLNVFVVCLPPPPTRPAPLRGLSSGPCAYISDHLSIILSYKATLPWSTVSFLLVEEMTTMSSQLRATLSHRDLYRNLLLPRVALWPSAHSCTFPPLTSISSCLLEKVAARLGSTPALPGCLCGAMKQPPVLCSPEASASPQTTAGAGFPKGAPSEL